MWARLCGINKICVICNINWYKEGSMKYFIYCCVLFLFFMLFYLQDSHAIMYYDDWVYAFMVNEDAENYMSVADDDVVRQPIQSFQDALVSQSHDYFKTNGRFVLHSLVQYFCGTMTMQRFAVLNSFVFALFTILFIKLAGWRHGIVNLLTILASIWILMPHKGITFMGNISLSVNYLWTSAATLTFLFLLEYLSRRSHSLMIICMAALFSFLVGSLQESFSVCIAGALVLNMLFRRTTLNKGVIAISIAYILGTLLCLLSPANFIRVDNNGGIGFNHRVVFGLLSSPPFVLLVITGLVLYYKRFLLSVCKSNLLLVSAIVLNLVFAIVVAYNGRHQLTALNVLSLLLLSRLWIKYRVDKIPSMKYASMLLILVAILSYYPVLQARKSYNETYMAFLDDVRRSTDGSVSIRKFDEHTQRIGSNRILEGNYVAVFTISDWEFYQRSLSTYLTKGKSNKLIRELHK